MLLFAKALPAQALIFSDSSDRGSLGDAWEVKNYLLETGGWSSPRGQRNVSLSNGEVRIRGTGNGDFISEDGHWGAWIGRSLKLLASVSVDDSIEAEVSVRIVDARRGPNCDAGYSSCVIIAFDDENREETVAAAASRSSRRSRRRSCASISSGGPATRDPRTR